MSIKRVSHFAPQTALEMRGLLSRVGRDAVRRDYGPKLVPRVREKTNRRKKQTQRR